MPIVLQAIILSKQNQTKILVIKLVKKFFKNKFVITNSEKNPTRDVPKIQINNNLCIEQRIQGSSINIFSAK